jgi:hypothetical protein
MIASSRYAGICSREVGILLAELLRTSPRPLTPLLEDLTGDQVTVQVLASGERHLTGQEQARLNAEGLITCRWRNAVLYAGQVVAASTAFLWLPARLPAEACWELDAGHLPAGKILDKYGARRAGRRALAAEGIGEAAGQDTAVRATAELAIDGVAVAITQEHIPLEFARSVVAAAAAARMAAAGGMRHMFS